jgi:hypothetical protein
MTFSLALSPLNPNSGTAHPFGSDVPDRNRSRGGDVPDQVSLE